MNIKNKLTIMLLFIYTLSLSMGCTKLAKEVSDSVETSEKKSESITATKEGVTFTAYKSKSRRNRNFHPFKFRSIDTDAT